MGLAIIDLGGGRRREDDPIDHAVGLTEVAAPGERVGPGERPLAVVHARDEAAAGRAAEALRAAFTIGDAAPPTGPAVLERLADVPRLPPVLPKAELHVHLEGTATPDLIRRLARRNGLEPPEGLFATPERFAWEGFLGFLAAYDRAASVIRTAEDYRDVTYEYLAGCAADGVVYVELTASRDHARLVGLTDAEHWEGIARGIDDAREQHGIEARILSSAVRNFGVEQALDGRARGGEPPPPLRRGLLAGRRRGRLPARPVRRGLRDRRRGRPGLHGARRRVGRRESVRAALELPVTRISHGVRAIEDPAVVESSRAAASCSRCAPPATSCSACSAASRSTRFCELRAAGVPVTLGSDDPPYFGASAAGEYEVARRHFGLDDDELRAITRTAIEASFAAPDLKTALRERVG